MNVAFDMPVISNCFCLLCAKSVVSVSISLNDFGLYMIMYFVILFHAQSNINGDLNVTLLAVILSTAIVSVIYQNSIFAHKLLIISISQLVAFVNQKKSTRIDNQIIRCFFVIVVCMNI
ncbi:MAG: hypothetical protein WCG25_00415 [bacterium]